MIDSVRCLLPLLVMVIGVAGTAEGAGPRGQAAQASIALIPVAVPALQGLDPVVARQLREVRAEMDTIAADWSAEARRRAAAFGTLGQLYHAYELFPEAATCYQNASLLEPDNFAWHHLLAHVRRQQSLLDLAIAEFEAAWALEPNDFAALLYLADLYLELDQLTEADVVLGRAINLSPGQPAAMAELGRLALRRRAYEKAVMYFSKALAAVPEANRLHYSLAMAYRGLGRVQDAQSHLERSGTVGLRPPDPLVDGLDQLREGERVHLVRGRLAYASERYEEARDEFQKAVDADPGSARALINLGSALAHLGDGEGAAACYREALTREPDNLTAAFNLASLLAAGGDSAEARPLLERVLAGRPEDGEAQLLLARVLVAEGDDEASLEYFERAAFVDPSSVDAVVGGASALVRLERYFLAVRVLEAGLERLPESIPIAFALARLLAAAPEQGIRDGGRALELARSILAVDSAPRHALVVAQALAELGRCQEAASVQAELVAAALEANAAEAAEIMRWDLEVYQQGPPCGAPLRSSGE